jgi:hypothetical protein
LNICIEIPDGNKFGGVSHDRKMFKGQGVDNDIMIIDLVLIETVWVWDQEITRRLDAL